MKTILLTLYACVCSVAMAQNITVQLGSAINKLENDAQFKHSIISMYVVDSKTGKVVFEKNAQTGLAPASCQKVVTSVSAFELLGKGYQYKTYIGKDYSSKIDKTDAGCLFVIGSGDPTLGSERWKSTTDTAFFKRVLSALKKNGYNIFGEDLVLEDYLYGTAVLPDGWIWQDIGNYYGAGCYSVNWRENQYELLLQPDLKVGFPAEIASVKPFIFDVVYDNHIRTGKAGSGDNAYIYAAPFSNIITTSGTIPQQAKPFAIKGSMPNPSRVLGTELLNYLVKNKITFKGSSYSALERSLHDMPAHKATHIIDSVLSPTLDSINYWFLKKSVNLYGEAFVKTIAYEKIRSGSTDTGIAIIKDFWSKRGIEKAALNMFDGSGLSPANRITTNALVTVMQYARQQKWFASFYNALPEMNGIKMKDGYINGVRSYTGYIKSKSGTEYSFSFIVNNFDGNAGTVREKIWKVLDILK
ncbi:D-alanyl-D-alanine carboxypeptidase/D-alanyl-D-alanine endopeptidase [Ferruginibacter sp.]|nr:D-alanyl-D-alanine carboxypeptidase/D-alanyl-D-alanine-endopeptidase [Ferruginibacter sp.]